MRVALTGYRGYIGSYLLPKGYRPFDPDLNQKQSIRREFADIKPDVVLHLAAKSNVDWCEKPENTDELYNSNCKILSNLLDVAEEVDVPVVLMSTDHVFSGKFHFGKYSEKSQPNPVNMYGLSKLGAEGFGKLYDNMKIIRTSYLFSAKRLMSTFWRPCTFLKRSFIHVECFTKQLEYYFANFEKMPKLLHMAGSDSVSWYKFVQTLYPGTTIEPVKQDNKNLVPRGHNLGLNVNLANSLGVPEYNYVDAAQLFNRFGL